MLPSIGVASNSSGLIISPHMGPVDAEFIGAGTVTGIVIVFVVVVVVVIIVNIVVVVEVDAFIMVDPSGESGYDGGIDLGEIASSNRASRVEGTDNVDECGGRGGR